MFISNLKSVSISIPNSFIVSFKTTDPTKFCVEDLVYKNGKTCNLVWLSLDSESVPVFSGKSYDLPSGVSGYGVLGGVPLPSNIDQLYNAPVRSLHCRVTAGGDDYILEYDVLGIMLGTPRYSWEAYLRRLIDFTCLCRFGLKPSHVTDDVYENLMIMDLFSNFECSTIKETKEERYV